MTVLSFYSIFSLLSIFFSVYILSHCPCHVLYVFSICLFHIPLYLAFSLSLPIPFSLCILIYFLSLCILQSLSLSSFLYLSLSIAIPSSRCIFCLFLSLSPSVSSDLFLSVPFSLLLFYLCIFLSRYLSVYWVPSFLSLMQRNFFLCYIIICVSLSLLFFVHANLSFILLPTSLSCLS